MSESFDQEALTYYTRKIIETGETIVTTENNNPPQEKYFYNVADPTILYLIESSKNIFALAIVFMCGFFHFMTHIGSLFWFANLLDANRKIPISFGDYKTPIILWGIITIFDVIYLISYNLKLKNFPKSPEQPINDRFQRYFCDVIFVCLDFATLGVSGYGLWFMLHMMAKSFEIFSLWYALSLFFLILYRMFPTLIRIDWIKTTYRKH